MDYLTRPFALAPFSITQVPSESVLVPNTLSEGSDGKSPVLEFFTDDNGRVVLPDNLLSTVRETPTLGSPLIHTSSNTSRSKTLLRVPTTQSTFSATTVVNVDSVRELTLEALCQVIDEHYSMQYAEIVSAEGYKKWTGSVVHRFIVLELRRNGRKTIWLRIDRRRSREVNMLVFLAKGATTPANDVAKLSAIKGKLIVGSQFETEQRFGRVPTLGDLRHLFRVIRDALQQYQLWPANCWFFVSLLHEHLGATGDGVFVRGTLPKPQLARRIRQTIKHRMRVLYSIPDPAAVAQLFGIDHDIDAFYRNAILQHIDPANAQSLNQFRSIMGCILCAQETLPLRVLLQLVPHPVGLAQGDIAAQQRSIARLALLLTGTYKDDVPIKQIDPSFSSFLLDPTRSGSFAIDTQSDAAMTLSCLRVMTAELHFNTYEVPTSFKGNLNIDDLVQSHISPQLLYACQYLMHHMSRVTSFDVNIIQGISTFLQEQLLSWVEVMIVTRSPLLAALGLLRSCEIRKGPSNSDVAALIDDIEKFMEISPEPVAESLNPHWSFYHFLRDPAHSDPFPFDVRTANVNEALIPACLRVLTAELHFNMFQLPTSFEANEDIWNIDDLAQSHISPQLLYACQYLMHHVAQLTIFDDTIIHWFSSFFQERFLSWLEVMSVTKSPFVAALHLLRSSKIGKASSEVLVLIIDAVEFVENYKEPITRSAAHIYLSALAFVPTNSKIHQHYSHVFPGIVALRKGRVSSWFDPGPPKLGVVSTVAFSPDGTLIVTGSADHTVQLWDVATGASIGEPLRGHTRWVWSVAFSPDGTQVASGSDDNTVRLWDVRTAASIGEPLKGHTREVNSVAFSPDGTQIISGSSDYTLRLWDGETGISIGEPLRNPSAVMAVAFSPGGTQIVSGSRDGALQLWDVVTGTRIGEPLRGHTDWVTSVAFSPDSMQIMSGSDDRTLRLWDVRTGASIGEPLRGHKDLVFSVAFSPDGLQIVSGSRDKTLRLWDVRMGVGISKPMRDHTDLVWSVAFSPDCTQIVSGSKDNTLRLQDLKLGDDQWKGDNSPHNDSQYPAELFPHGSFRFKDGWILGSNDELLIWVPPGHRIRLEHPNGSRNIGVPHTVLDFRNFKYGTEWSRCRDSANSFG